MCGQDRDWLGCSSDSFDGGAGQSCQAEDRCFPVCTRCDTGILAYRHTNICTNADCNSRQSTRTEHSEEQGLRGPGQLEAAHTTRSARYEDDRDEHDEAPDLIEDSDEDSDDGIVDDSNDEIGDDSSDDEEGQGEEVCRTERAVHSPSLVPLTLTAEVSSPRTATLGAADDALSPSGPGGDTSVTRIPVDDALLRSAGGVGTTLGSAGAASPPSGGDASATRIPVDGASPHHLAGGVSATQRLADGAEADRANIRQTGWY